MKIIKTIFSTDLITNSFLSSFCSFIQAKNKNHVFSKLVACNEKYFCFFLLRVALYFKAMPNSIDLYKGIFLHSIPARIIVP